MVVTIDPVYFLPAKLEKYQRGRITYAQVKRDMNLGSAVVRNIRNTPLFRCFLYLVLPDRAFLTRAPVTFKLLQILIRRHGPPGIFQFISRYDLRITRLVHPRQPIRRRQSVLVQLIKRIVFALRRADHYAERFWTVSHRRP